MVVRDFDPSMILVILPEILLLILAVFVLLYDVLWARSRSRDLGWLTAGGLVVIAVVSLAVARPGLEAPRLVWGGMLREDWMGFIFKMMFIGGAAVTTLFAMDVEELQRGEFFLLLLTSTIGMGLMASAADLIMLYLAVETTSIPLYILAGFFIRSEKSTEAGFKYLLFGALTSTVMLYGFSLLYGFSGTTSLYQLADLLRAGQLSTMVLVGTILLILVGFGFKVSAVPFHFWAPDVYEGAPTPVAGFLSTASKAAGFAVLIRVLLVVFPATIPQWGAVVAAISTATMTLGNTIALAQRNIKRLLAYSSIAHAGFMLIGVVSISSAGLAATVFYLFVYLITNLAAFGIVATYWRAIGSDEIDDYAGMSRRSPGLALAMLVAFLSLAGMPPFGGFFAKVWVFAAAIDSGLVWLAVVGIINAIIGLYYYLIVLKVVYLYRSEEEEQPVPISRPYALALTVLTIGIILIGTIFAPWWSWSTAAAAAIF